MITKEGSSRKKNEFISFAGLIWDEQTGAVRFGILNRLLCSRPWNTYRHGAGKRSDWWGRNLIFTVFDTLTYLFSFIISAVL